jgi:sulfate permease, SulP family
MTEIRTLSSMVGENEDDVEEMIPPEAVPQGVEVYDIAGPFFFGAAEQFKDVLAEVSKKPKVLIVRMRSVPFVDSTGLHVLRDLIQRTQRDGTRVIIAETQPQPREALQKSGIVELVGADYVVGSLDFALAVAAQITEKGRLTPLESRSPLA